MKDFLNKQVKKYEKKCNKVKKYLFNDNVFKREIASYAEISRKINILYNEMTKRKRKRSKKSKKKINEKNSTKNEKNNNILNNNNEKEIKNIT